MKKFGLIGRSLQNTFSKDYFLQKCKENNWDATYENFSIPNEDACIAFLKNCPLNGLNVTNPYKKLAIKIVDELSEEAKACGAINCLHQVNQKWIGYNTDVFGFNKTLEKMLHLQSLITYKKAVIIGDGGVAAAVKFVLNQRKINFDIIRRNESSQEISDACIWIQCTPLGMHPNINDFPPIQYSHIKANDICIDLIYMPEETLFLKKCAEQGAACINGLMMLHAQADASHQIWMHS